MKHALSRFEQERRAANRPRPPRLSDWKGTKWNKARRALNHHSALEHWHRLKPWLRGQSQEERDRGELGPFHEWIRGARAEASRVQSIAKFQAASRRQP